MRAGLEYLSSNALIAFPLADDQDVPDYIRRFIVDAFFTVPSHDADRDCLLTGVSITGGGAAFSVSVELSDGTEVDFEYGGTHSGRYAVLRSQDMLSCIVVAPSELHEFSGALRFMKSVSETTPAHVNSIQLWDGLGMYASIIAEVSGDVKFSNGYSTTVVSSGNDVTISAVPGAGKGLYPCGDCPDDLGTSGPDVIEVGDPLVSDSGILRFENDSCFDIIPYHTEMNGMPGIQIINKCVACCQCSQYADKVESLRGLAAIVSRAGSNVLALIDALNGRINYYNSQPHKHVLGGDNTGWEVTVTGIKKDPSVGGVKGLTRVRGVVGVSNMTASSSSVALTTFDVGTGASAHSLGGESAEGSGESSGGGDFEGVRYFTSAESNNSGKGKVIPELGSGMSAKFTGVAKIEAGEDDDLVITATVQVSSGGTPLTITRTVTC